MASAVNARKTIQAKPPQKNTHLDIAPLHLHTHYRNVIWKSKHCQQIRLNCRKATHKTSPRKFKKF